MKKIFLNLVSIERKEARTTKNNYKINGFNVQETIEEGGGVEIHIPPQRKQKRR